MSVPSRKGARLGDKRLSFTFDGRKVDAFEGDTVASALLASGERLFARSIKYHRPRGVLSAGPEEPDALVTVGEKPCNVPNLPATTVAVQQDMQVFSQNRWPTLRYDLGAALSLGGGVFSAGFYYKTFIWPGWRSYEGIIRRLAGFGAAPADSAIEPPRVRHLNCDVMVVGAGAAGISAALAASRRGANTIICEREPTIGGELEFEDAVVDGQPAIGWLENAKAELSANGVRVLTETAVVGEAARLVVAHHEPGGQAMTATAYRVQAENIVFATGATEQPIVFANNDRPGVMLLGAAERYLSRYGIQPGESAVIFGNHNRIYSAARRLADAGTNIAAVVDTRSNVVTEEKTAVRERGIECIEGHAVTDTTGRARITAVRIASLSNSERPRLVRCDAVLVSGGWRPNAHANNGTGDYRHAAGSAAGCFDIAATLHSGFNAGAQAFRGEAETSAAISVPPATGDPVPDGAAFWRSPVASAMEKKQFVDLQNDVTVADLRQAAAHGFVDIEHVKRFTTLGVGTEQGETSGLPGAAILAEITGDKNAPVHLSRRRQPYQPATLSTLARHRRGQLLRPERHTALHEWHLQHQGFLEDSGGWMRPTYYRSSGDSLPEAVATEAAAVREHGGIADASTLGKLEIAGPDAALFLDSVYLTKASTIKVGRSKYMLMLREDGMVLDDGLVLRLENNRFLATVSSGHAGHVLSHLRFHRDLSADRHRVRIADVTESWSVIAVAGPKSREALNEILGEPWHESLSGMEHMDFDDGTWKQSDLRLLRASFSGELAFELHCRPSIAVDLWTALVDAGLHPYGLEALDVLRIEKGYLTSAEINGQTTPHDLGFSALVDLGNSCVGRDLLDRPALTAAKRQRLVGIRAAEKGLPFLPGAQLTLPDKLDRSLGYVTSAAFSPALEEWVGLALLQGDQANDGNEILARDPLHDRDTPVRVTSTVHFDPDGSRMRS